MDAGAGAVTDLPRWLVWVLFCTAAVGGFIFGLLLPIT